MTKRFDYEIGDFVVDKFGKGWKIEIWLEDECVKSFVTRK